MIFWAELESLRSAWPDRGRGRGRQRILGHCLRSYAAECYSTRHSPWAYSQPVYWALARGHSRTQSLLETLTSDLAQLGLTPHTLLAYYKIFFNAFSRWLSKERHVCTWFEGLIEHQTIPSKTFQSISIQTFAAKQQTFQSIKSEFYYSGISQLDRSKNT